MLIRNHGQHKKKKLYSKLIKSMEISGHKYRNSSKGGKKYMNLGPIMLSRITFIQALEEA